MLGIGLPEHTRGRVSAELAEAGCYAAFRGTSLRISPHLHTTRQDVDRLLETLARITGSTAT
jgi:selenocysteine lyase/cysteine desulfurase